jgi:histidinol-phosphatase
MNSVTPVEWLTFLVDCADLADDIAMHYYQKTGLKTQQKDNDTPVTQADVEAEKKIREYTATTYPDLAIFGEEEGMGDMSAPFKLIIDPIDGTKNYMRGLPFFANLLAIEAGGDIVAGVASAPAMNDRWQAAKGLGATYNGKSIQVSTINRLDEAQVFHGALSGQEAIGAPEGFIPLLTECWRQRGYGDFYAHVCVAMGVGEFAVDFNLNVWDIAPLKIIVEEAGGRFTDINGGTSVFTNTIISSNGTTLHDTVLERLESC